VLYKLGETFFHLPLRDARRQLKSDIKRYDGEIGKLQERAEECEKGMKDLKVQL
jgi:prefoldin subunit 4